VIKDLALSPRRRTSPVLFAVLTALVGVAMYAAPASAARGRSEGDRVVFGSSVIIPAGDEVTGDLVVMAGSAEVHGTIDGDAVVMAGSLYVAPDGVVKGDTVALGGSVDNESTAKHGNSGGAGPVPVPTITAFPDFPSTRDTPFAAAADEFDARRAWVEVLVFLGILTLLAFVFFPVRTKMTLDYFLHKPALAGVLGITWPFTLAIVCVGLAVTVLGIVLIPVAVIAIGLGYLVGRAAIATFLGRRFFEYSKVVEPNPLATLGLGLLIITVLEGIAPIWVGIVLEACLSALAIGAATLTILNKESWPRMNSGAPPSPGTYAGPPPPPVFAPPGPPPPPGPPAIPQ
jgi:hypothetical protein